MNATSPRQRSAIERFHRRAQKKAPGERPRSGCEGLHPLPGGIGSSFYRCWDVPFCLTALGRRTKPASRKSLCADIFRELVAFASIIEATRSNCSSTRSRDMGTLTFASLFSGCGGFDLGFVDAGYRCVAAFDLDPIAVETHRRNFGSNAVALDLTEATVPLPRKPLDVLLAGTPCQGFSTIGKRNVKDPRNRLLVRAAEIAVEFRPRVVVIENVLGVLSGPHRAFWDEATGLLKANGYRVAELRCDASSLGVAQNRRRILAIAWRTPNETTPTLPIVQGSSLRTVLTGIDEAADHAPQMLCARSMPGKIARNIGPGQKLCNVREGPRSVHTWQIPDVFGMTTRWEQTVLATLLRRRRQKRARDFGDADPVSARALYTCLQRPVTDALESLVRKDYVRRVGKLYDLVHTFNGKFRRPRLDQPAPTVDTRFGDAWYFLHPTEHRAFTSREAARIQGFPDTFVFSGSPHAQIRLIGNAVPPPLARLVATCVRNTFLE